MAKWLVILGLVSGWLAAVAVGADEPVNQANLVDELMKREIESWEMIKHKDVPGLRDYFADDAALIFAGATRYTKAEFLKLVPDFKLTTFTITGKADMVRLTPDAATPGLRKASRPGHPEWCLIQPTGSRSFLQLQQIVLHIHRQPVLRDR